MAAGRPRRTDKARKRAADRIARANADAGAVVARAWAKIAAASMTDPVVPLAQRESVVSLRGPRVEQDGAGWRLANPIRHLVARNASRVKADRTPNFGMAHLIASERLLIAWTETKDGIGIASSLGMMEGGGNSGTAGSATLAAIGRLEAARGQIEADREWRAARGFLGPSQWAAIEAVVLKGLDVATWAEAEDLNRDVATGYLKASLDRLVEYYSREPVRRSEIRSAQVISSTAASTS